MEGHRQLRLAVRDEYLNFYHCGQSVARVSLDRMARPRLEVHQVRFRRRARPSVHDLSDGTVRYRSGNNSEVPYQGLQTIAAWIRRADKYSGYEKSGMECVVAANDVVIDLEMGIPWWPEQSTGAGTPERTGKYAPRMDMVALEDGPGGRIDIVFWEAKTLGDSRLRSRSNPEVIRQLQVYNKYLSRPRLPGRGFRSLCRDVQAFGDHPTDGCGASQRNSAPAARQHCVPDCGGSRNSCSRSDAEAVDIPLRVGSGKIRAAGINLEQPPCETPERVPGLLRRRPENCRPGSSYSLARWADLVGIAVLVEGDRGIRWRFSRCRERPYGFGPIEYAP